MTALIVLLWLQFGSAMVWEVANSKLGLRVGNFPERKPGQSRTGVEGGLNSKDIGSHS